MKNLFDPEITVFADRIASVKEDIRCADVLALSPSGVSKDQAGRMKSSVLIQLAAAFENFLSKMTQRLNLALSEKKTMRPDVSSPLMSLVLYSKFDSLKSAEGIKGWGKRVEMLRSINSSEVAIFPSEISIFGSKTPRKNHLELLWEIYSFGALGMQTAPSMAHLLALDSVADSRNEIAHGEICPKAAGKKKTTLDLKNLAEKLEELGLHLAMCFEEYVRVDGHRR